MPLSRITVASMADIGYEVNMSAADAYKPTVASTLVSRASSSVVSTTTSNSQSTATTATRNLAPIATLFNNRQPDRHVPGGIVSKSATSTTCLTSFSSKVAPWSSAVDELLTKNWWG